MKTHIILLTIILSTTFLSIAQSAGRKTLGKERLSIEGNIGYFPVNGAGYRSEHGISIDLSLLYKFRNYLKFGIFSQAGFIFPEDYSRQYISYGVSVNIFTHVGSSNKFTSSKILILNVGLGGISELNSIGGEIPTNSNGVSLGIGFHLQKPIFTNLSFIAKLDFCNYFFPNPYEFNYRIAMPISIGLNYVLTRKQKEF